MQIYIEMVEAKAFEDIEKFQKRQITKNWPSYFAIHNEVVVGWADISSSENPRLCHRGFLGMGILEKYRGKGLGSQLLTKALDHAKKVGMEKVELTVYATNAPAIALYRKLGFTEIGVIKHFRKLNDRYFGGLEMEKFL